jgi:hypothetical protein
MVEFKAARKANIKNIVNVFNGFFSENQKEKQGLKRLF